ncbi:MAG: threonylcarbamoyl-AMP synthase [Saprospiraceae bacterium]|nr:threonylcarbamoyl-AMP synthase [Saprospiraceae bacterium]
MMNFLEEAEFSAQLILKNEVILYPTDTIWGIGANINDKSSVERVASIKQRPPNKSFIVLVNSLEMLKRYVIRLHPRIETLLYFHKQPLSIIYPHVKDIPDYLLADDKSLAIRVCHHPFCKELIRILDQPLISTSANFSGEPSPGDFSEINPLLLHKVDYVVEFGRIQKEKSQPSVIAKYDEEGELIFIRE